MISDFPGWGEIELSDRAAIEEFLKREESVTSEPSFENLFVWRLTYDFRASVLDDALCILAQPQGKEPFFLPPIGAVDPAAVVERLFGFLEAQGYTPSIRRAPEKLTRRLEGFRVEADEGNADYVYLASDLANLAGRKYHKKRNQIAQFASKYQYEYRRIAPDILPQCEALQQTWCEVRDCFTPENIALAEENQAVLEALENFEELGIFGGAILIQGKVEAFTIGGRLNRDTLVVHFEKGNPEFPGIYQVVNQAFCADFGSGYTYVNREQDLGDPGLRQAKRSYHPHHMVEKYVITGP